jgi:hypothetical protein
LRVPIKYTVIRDRNGVTIGAETVHDGNRIASFKRVGITEIRYASPTTITLFRQAFRSARNEVVHAVVLTGEGSLLWDLARQYYLLTEEFDLRNCSGRSDREPNCAMPINAHESGRSNAFAQSVRKQLSARCGNPVGFKKAREEYIQSLEFSRDMAELHRKFKEAQPGARKESN